MAHLGIATRILRARLAKTSRVDISILENHEAQSTNDLNEHFGEIICHFCPRPSGRVALLSFIREDGEQDISHVIAFYVNTRFKIIQPSERKRFANRLGKGVRLGLDVKLGVINANVDVHPSFEASILIELAVFMLNLRLATDFVPHREADTCVIRLFQSEHSFPTLSLKPCIGLS